MVALEGESGRRFRFFPLPARYNFRYSTVYPPTGPAMPALLHLRDVGQTDRGELMKRVVSTISDHLEEGVVEAMATGGDGDDGDDGAEL